MEKEKFERFFNVKNPRAVSSNTGRRGWLVDGMTEEIEEDYEDEIDKIFRSGPFADEYDDDFLDGERGEY